MVVMSYTCVGVKREVLARILQEQIDRRGGIEPQKLGQYRDGLYQASLAEEISAAGKISAYAAKRRIYAIFNPEYTNSKGERIEQELVEFNTADKILSSLDLNHLWHTDPELADSIVRPSPGKPVQLAEANAAREEGNCRRCGVPWSEWTAGCSSCQSRHRWRRRQLKRKGLKEAA